MKKFITSIVSHPFHRDTHQFTAWYCLDPTNRDISRVHCIWTQKQFIYPLYGNPSESSTGELPAHNTWHSYSTNSLHSNSCKSLANNSDLTSKLPGLISILLNGLPELLLCQYSQSPQDKYLIMWNSLVPQVGMHPVAAHHISPVTHIDWGNVIWDACCVGRGCAYSWGTRKFHTVRYLPRGLC